MKRTTYRFLLLTLILSYAGYLNSQTLTTLTQGTAVSIRGLSAVSDQVVWVSGSKGTVGRSLDGGSTWNWLQVPGYEKREFRDIEAFDSLHALIIAIAEPGEILKTSDGGKTWKAVYLDSTRGVFMDAFDFSSRSNGTAIGDPIDGKIYLVSTSDGGDTWKRNANQPVADSGEACFASSGTNIVATTAGFSFATGGVSSRFHTNGTAIRLPLAQGKESTGANSLAMFGNKAIVVGGDFAHDTVSTGNCALITMAAKPIVSIPVEGPHGYRSCVEYLDSRNLIACGTSGVDISKDGGKHWQLISKESFHVCQKAKSGKAVFLAGNNGRVAKFMP